MSQFIYRQLGAQLDNPKGIVQSCASHRGINKLKEKINHYKDRSCRDINHCHSGGTVNGLISGIVWFACSSQELDFFFFSYPEITKQFQIPEIASFAIGLGDMGLQDNEGEREGFMFKLWSLDSVSQAEAVNIDVNYLSSCLVWLEGFEHWDRTRCQAEPFWLSDVYPRFKPLKFGCHWVMRRSWHSPFQGNWRAVFLLVVLNQKDLRKLEMSTWRVVVSHLRKLEEFRIQSSLHITKPQRQLIGLESNIYKCANIIFFLSTVTPIFIKVHSETIFSFSH